ncbi:MAG: MBL fold metallo-hydrolase [Clostridia bacterium]|nr:MBL fold metallo-hydrolase [Clostridia bacterium]
MKIKVLSSQQCENKDANNGDCFILDNGQELVLYDCGCEEYAQYVMEYMKENKYQKVKVVLSHNDDDHFKGIPTLVENDKVSEITTVLLLKYVDELIDIIDDGRKNRESIKRQITEFYDNIYQLSGNNLQDAFEYAEIAEGITVSGPGKDYILNTAAKGLDTTECDHIDGETITNATSIHLSVKILDKKVLLTGDSTFESVMQENVKDFKVIQLPHHGKKDTGEAIMKELKNTTDEVYIVSDNTGNSNGGSDDLETKGYDVRNTKNSGMISLDYHFITRNRESRGNLSEIYNNKKQCK